MLTLNGVTISVQSFGSSWAIFLTGKREDIEARYNSFWNWKGIFGNSGEIDWWHDGCGMFYTYPKNFIYAMQMGALQEILNTRDTKGTNALIEARQTAADRISMIDKVTWIKKRAIDGDVFEVGN